MNISRQDTFLAGVILDTLYIGKLHQTVLILGISKKLYDNYFELVNLFVNFAL